MVSAKWTSVTRGNFSSVLPQVLEDIKSSDFVAMDTELTGLNLTRAHRNSNLDDLITRYGKLRESVSNFGLLQVGLACFKWSSSKQKYKISAYSFYVFPSAANGIQQERKFACQLGSLTFLSEFKFDFNKAFHEGIPFITRKEENIIKSNSAFYNDNASKQQKPLILLKDEEKAIVSEVFEKIDQWLESSDHPNSTESGILDLPPMNSFQRLIFYQQIPLKYGEKLIITKKSSGILSVKRADLDPESRAAAFEEEKLQFEKALEEQIGFRKVIDCIIESEIPVIGHNCWVDLLHFYQKFIDNNLPTTIQGFKEEILKCFPKIIDTKYLARLVNIKETSLGELTEMSSKYPESSFFLKKDKDEESSNLFHDAGFDAICTGRVFLTLLSHFLRPKDLQESPLNDSLAILLKNDTLCNRLNILQSDYPHLDLKGQELEPDRSSVLYVYGMTGNVSVSDLQSALQLLLQVEEKISCQIHWLNEGTAAFIQFEQQERANDVLLSFKSRAAANSDPLTLSAVNDDPKASSAESLTSVNSASPTTSKVTNLLNKIKFVPYKQYQEKRDQLLQSDESADNPNRKRSKQQ